MVRTTPSARASNIVRYGGNSHDQPRMSPPWSVSIVTAPRWGT